LLSIEQWFRNRIWNWNLNGKRFGKFWNDYNFTKIGIEPVVVRGDGDCLQRTDCDRTEDEGKWSVVVGGWSL